MARRGRRVFPRREGWVYVFRARHPATGVLVRHGYIGKTRWLKLRLAQHLERSDWRDTVTEWDVLWYSPDVTAFGLWWREVWYILTRMPLYNYQWNRLNPRRIPKYEQRRRSAAYWFARSGEQHLSAS